MPGALPEGEPVPATGTLPDSARAGLGERPFGLYVHVPFCTTRCGYCDFNTYTADEPGGSEFPRGRSATPACRGLNTYFIRPSRTPTRPSP